MANDDPTVEFRHRKIAVNGAQIHVAEAGLTDSERTLVFLHGWPEDWSEFERLMSMSSRECRVVALDLPGVGGSTTALGSGVKSNVARYVMGAIDALALRSVTLVGHDAGGMVAYACLRHHAAQLESVVIASTVIPGLDPWDQLLSNPHIWHFEFHSLPKLPELLVAGKQAEYFDFFYNAIAAHPESIGPSARQRYAEAYSAPSALKTGFDWYRALRQDAEENKAKKETIRTPLLYLRGEKDSGSIPIERYLLSFREAGIANLQSAVIANSGHFTPEEQPRAVWEQIRRFLNAE